MRVVSSVSMPSSTSNGGVSAVFSTVTRRHHLDLPGRHVGVLGAFRTQSHHARKLDDPLGAQPLGRRERIGDFRVERALDDT
jgi:hypothetical protein